MTLREMQRKITDFCIICQKGIDKKQDRVYNICKLTRASQVRKLCDVLYLYELNFKGENI